MALLIYVDDIIIASNNEEAAQSLKESLSRRFKMRDLGPVKYFLGIEVTRSSSGISISQRKYAVEPLADAGCLGSKPASTPVKPNLKLSKIAGELLENPGAYRRLIGRLLHWTIMRPDFSYSI